MATRLARQGGSRLRNRVGFYRSAGRRGEGLKHGKTGFRRRLILALSKSVYKGLSLAISPSRFRQSIAAGHGGRGLR